MIGRKLNVATILEGSVRKAGNRVRITVQLVKVADGYHLWSQTYDRTLEDIFAIQDDIAQSVVKELRTTLLGETADAKADKEAIAAVAAAVKGRSTNPEAHRLFLQARHFIDRLTREDTTKGIGYLKEALALEPEFALAWAELGRAYATEADWGWASPAEGYGRAREPVARALALEPDLAEGHAGMGHLQMAHDWDWRGAEASFRRALELAPGNALVLHQAGVLAEMHGPFRGGDQAPAPRGGAESVERRSLFPPRMCVLGSGPSRGGGGCDENGAGARAAQRRHAWLAVDRPAPSRLLRGGAGGGAAGAERGVPPPRTGDHPSRRGPPGRSGRGAAGTHSRSMPISPPIRLRRRTRREARQTSRSSGSSGRTPSGIPGPYGRWSTRSFAPCTPIRGGILSCARWGSRNRRISLADSGPYLGRDAWISIKTSPSTTGFGSPSAVAVNSFGTSRITGRISAYTTVVAITQ